MSNAYGNFTVTDNLLVAPANFGPYCVTAPVDSRLPGGGGYQVCGLYDINPSKFGQVNNLVTFASKYGKQFDHYNGVDVTVNARLSRGAIVQGGLSVGRTETNNCFVVDSPQQLVDCDVKPPFQPQVKLLGTYPLPWELQAGVTFQTMAGPQILATQAVPSAQKWPSLSANWARNLCSS